MRECAYCKAPFQPQGKGDLFCSKQHRKRIREVPRAVLAAAARIAANGTNPRR